jgi:glucose/mannose-6-phosphate isomerase
VFAGIGGVASSASIARQWLDIGEPFEVVREYTLPRYVDGDTLCVVASYSGNTEETLSALQDARDKGAQVVVISHGGRLRDIATEAGLPFLQLPDTGEPRYAVWYVVKALAVIFDRCGLTQGKAAELEAQAEWYAGQLGKWRPDIATGQNEAKRIALELAGKSVVIYTGPELGPVAHKWKIGFNENAKHVAWCNQYPEFNHNEFLGWTKQPVNKPYAVIDIRSSLDHAQIQKRFEVSERLLSGVRPAPVVVRPEGEDRLRQMMYAIGLGDFTSIYLALLSGLNPADASITDTLKKELA